MRSIPLQQFRKGYKKHAADLGYKQASARPWQIGDVRAVLQTMLQKSKSMTGLPAVMLARDGFILAVLWQTSSRGCNAGAWRLENVILPTGANTCHVPSWKVGSIKVMTARIENCWNLTCMSPCAGQSAIPYLLPKLILPRGSKIHLQPDKTKTGAKDGPMSVEIRGDELCSITWLCSMMVLSLELGQPITNFLSRPLGKDKKSFLERKLTSAAVARITLQQFRGAGINGKHTVHGSRRGSMQHAVHVLGQSAEQAGAAAQIRTPAIVQRYLDPFRHCK